MIVYSEMLVHVNLSEFSCGWIVSGDVAIRTSMQ